MKKVNVILVALTLMLGTLFTTAANPETTSKTPFSAEIENLLEDNDLFLGEDVFATITFVVNTEGELVLLDVDTENKSVEQLINDRLNYYKIKAKMQKGREYKVPVHIVSEE
jgi:hypothetical protein